MTAKAAKLGKQKKLLRTKILFTFTPHQILSHTDKRLCGVKSRNLGNNQNLTLNYQSLHLEFDIITEFLIPKAAMVHPDFDG
jgi:hypothetical protein